MPVSVLGAGKTIINEAVNIPSNFYIIMVTTKMSQHIH